MTDPWELILPTLAILIVKKNHSPDTVYYYGSCIITPDSPCCCVPIKFSSPIYSAKPSLLDSKLICFRKLPLMVLCYYEKYFLLA